jgi:probable HAF family extracellular repeat protein
MRDLSALTEGADGVSVAVDGNDRGQAEADSTTQSGERHVVLWDGDRMPDLGTLGGSLCACRRDQRRRRHCRV